jgi:hypothetical protein
MIMEWLSQTETTIDNLQAEIHELLQHQAPTLAAPDEDVDLTSDVNES